MSSKVFLFCCIILSSGPVANALLEQPWPDSTIHSILLPTNPPPEEPEDSYDCVFENVTQYYDVPKPTGALLDALFDYGDDMFEACRDATGADHDDCYPEKEQWCQFMTERPDKVASDLSVWGSTVSSWWAAHSSQAVEVAEECPQYWFEAGVEVLDGRSWLNKTIIFAGCDTDSDSPSQSDSDSLSVTLGPTTTHAPAPASTEVQTSAVSTTEPKEGAAPSVLRRGVGEEMWKVAGSGIIVAMVNAVL